MLKKLAVIASVFFSLLLFASLIGYVIWFSLTNSRYVKLSPVGQNLPAEGILVPSEVLNSQAGYNQQRITLRGKVEPEMVVCERKECPAGDICCGCPPERNLKIVDAEASLISPSQKILRVTSPTGESLCQRSKINCDYDCQDWLLGGVYDVRGLFLTDTLQVEGKVLVGKPNPLDSVKNFFLEMKKKISGLRTSGSYILQ